VRTVLVTCTNGELGDGPGGVKPEDPAHDESVVVPLRMQELEASCRALGVSHLELLGYHDSGMEGWPQNDAPGRSGRRRWPRPGTGWRAHAQYQPQVVVTYDENGFYGHPDHIQANRITLRRHRRVRHPGQAVLHRRAALDAERLRRDLAEAGIERPAEVEENPDFGTPDELITTTVDCAAVAGRKYASLAAHASQSDNIFFLRMGEELFARSWETRASSACRTRRAPRHPRTISSPACAKAEPGPRLCWEKRTQARPAMRPTTRFPVGADRSALWTQTRRGTGPRRSAVRPR
jgi:LmbE family N-acetylglucosaminyl deacetylase